MQVPPGSGSHPLPTQESRAGPAPETASEEQAFVLQKQGQRSGEKTQEGGVDTARVKRPTVTGNEWLPETMKNVSST